MLNKLDDLADLMPPPASPRAAMGDWSIAERALGTPLPDDYTTFIGRYGTGRIAGFLWVLNPFEENPNLNLLSVSGRILQGDREIREEFPEEIPQPLFPEPGGLLPWAVTDNGDRLYWRTYGEPNSWLMLVWESRGPEYVNYSLTMTGFLWGWLQGEMRVPVFPPEDWEPVFEQDPRYGA